MVENGAIDTEPPSFNIAIYLAFGEKETLSSPVSLAVRSSVLPFLKELELCAIWKRH